MAVRRRPNEDFTISQAAAVLGVAPETLRRMDRRGESPARREGNRRIYTQEDINRLRDMIGSRKRRVTTTIAIVNQKGGVGKTTISINLSGALATKGYRVLIVDFDPQANCSFGLDVLWNSLDGSIADVLGYDSNGPTRTLSSIIRPLTDYQPNLFLAPSHLNLAAAEMSLHNALGREMKLDKALDNVRSEYDFIFIDAPPSLGLLSINAMVAADAILIPIDGAFAIEGVRQLLETRKGCAELSRHPIHVLGGVLNRQRLNTANYATILEMASQLFGRRMFKTIIPERTAVDGSTAVRCPVVFSGLPEADPYFKLAEEVVQNVAAISET